LPERLILESKITKVLIYFPPNARRGAAPKSGRFKDAPRVANPKRIQRIFPIAREKREATRENIGLERTVTIKPGKRMRLCFHLGSSHGQT